MVRAGVIVLDAHALVWWASDHRRLGCKARQAIEGECGNPRGALQVSSISTWEIALLVERGRLVLSMLIDAWWEAVGNLEKIRIVPLSDTTAIESTGLPGTFNENPADRVIVTLAREHSIPVITADEKIHAYPYVESVW